MSFYKEIFITFSEIICFLAPKVVSLLHRIQKVINSNVVSHRATDVCFKRIKLLFKKG
jgi:hypothetical protein